MKPTNWREQINVHPAADLFPMMPDDELDELAADIEKHGLRQAIDFQGDELLDGRNRFAAIHRIKDEARRKSLLGTVASTKRVMQVSDPIAYVISANVRRRHLTTEKKRELVEKLLKAKPERSDRETAKIADSNRTTVGQIRHELGAAGSRAGLVHEQRHVVQVVEVQHPRVVGVAGIERVRCAAEREGDRPARLG